MTSVGIAWVGVLSCCGCLLSILACRYFLVQIEKGPTGPVVGRTFNWCKSSFTISKGCEFMSADKKVLKGNCYIEETEDGLCAVGFHDVYEPHLTIPEGVTRIGSHAFERYYGLERVEIPDSVSGIGDHAFCRCSSLKTITLGSNIKSLHRCAFSDCFQLVEADLTQTQIEILEAGMFDNCKKLHTIKLPKTLVKISAHSILGAENCVSLELNEGLMVIGKPMLNL